jgi:AcrR family transcriptional regulator
MSQPDEKRTRRADAVRNRDAILDAALSALSRDMEASMAEIAAAAGIGRVTLYGHFSSREELVDAVFARTMQRAEAQLAGLDLTGDAAAALDRLVRSSWRVVAEFQSILGAAELALGGERVRAYHDQPMARVENLIARGQAEGGFRVDQPTAWLTACFYAVLHAGAAELRAGRLDEAKAAMVIPASIAALLMAPMRMS